MNHLFAELNSAQVHTEHPIGMREQARVRVCVLWASGRYGARRKDEGSILNIVFLFFSDSSFSRCLCATSHTHTHTHSSNLYLLSENLLFTIFSSLITFDQCSWVSSSIEKKNERARANERTNERATKRYYFSTNILWIDWKSAVGKTYCNKLLAALETSFESIYHRRSAWPEQATFTEDCESIRDAFLLLCFCCRRRRRRHCRQTKTIMLMRYWHTIASHWVAKMALVSVVFTFTRYETVRSVSSPNRYWKCARSIIRPPQLLPTVIIIILGGTAIRYIICYSFGSRHFFFHLPCCAVLFCTKFIDHDAK